MIDESEGQLVRRVVYKYDNAAEEALEREKREKLLEKSEWIQGIYKLWFSEGYIGLTKAKPMERTININNFKE